VRIRKKGSGGTHNGMRDIIKCIKTDEFPRIRTGIGKPPEYMDIADYVLSNFNDTEKETVFKAFGKISECMETIIKEGIDVAMNRFNKKDD
jgi:PTH1 family peptidyl-tRNA hydrolase